MVLAVKNPLPMQETKEMWVPSLGQEDPLEERMATHSSILAWGIPWTAEPRGYSLWGHKESDTTEHADMSLLTFTLTRNFHLLASNGRGV